MTDNKLQALPTLTQGPGRFANFDLQRVPSPCFVIDEIVLQRNLESLNALADESGMRILLALKAFAMRAVAPLIDAHLYGVCASSLWETRFARKHFQNPIATYAPAFAENEIAEIARLSEHVIFNTPDQLARFGDTARTENAKIGLRVNPQHSESPIEKYDPSAPRSRLGTRLDALCQKELPQPIDGLHMHNLCEQDFAPLKRSFDVLEENLPHILPQLKWLNLGGGHLLTADFYDRKSLIEFSRHIAQKYDLQIYLEPGAAVAFDAGILVGEVLDIIDADGALAILDISATCHMPDVLEAPYRPALLGDTTDGKHIRFAGPTCLAGDIIGDYRLKHIPPIGGRVAFLDQAPYTMVKTSTFNGVKLPSIALWNSDTDDLKILREFTYQDFENRLA